MATLSWMQWINNAPKDQYQKVEAYVVPKLSNFEYIALYIYVKETRTYIVRIDSSERGVLLN